LTLTSPPLSSSNNETAVSTEETFAGIIQFFYWPPNKQLYAPPYNTARVSILFLNFGHLF
jgi:hypothetical protein